MTDMGSFGGMNPAAGPSRSGLRRPRKAMPRVIPNETTPVASRAVMRATAASGHNVFRPDIFRVSEGYLN